MKIKQRMKIFNEIDSEFNGIIKHGAKLNDDFHIVGMPTSIRTKLQA